MSWDAFRFCFFLCLVMIKIKVSRCSENDELPATLTDGVLFDEKIPEVNEIESTEIGFEVKTITRPFVPKCCNLTFGYTFHNKSVCVETEDEFLPDFEDVPEYLTIAKGLPVSARYEYYIGDPCPDGKYIIDPATYEDDKYFIFTNGTLLYLDQTYSKENFCLETLNGSIRAFICFGSSKPIYQLSISYVLYATCLLISIPFLLATAIIHLCIDMLRDLRGKSLSCHVLCLAIGYFVLAVVQLGSDQLDEGLCVAAGFIIQFFFVASFFWLNVICYNTWRCIKNDFRCTTERFRPASEKVIFVCYSLYGWYGPVMLSIVTMIMDFEPAIPEFYLKPNFGLSSCWFYSDDAALPYFYGPVAIVILINVVFFLMSTRKIYVEQKRRRKDKRNSLGKNLSIRIYTKTLQECFYLFCIMGVNWTAEVISWAVGGSQAVWLITDMFNALQGIMIFYLFVLRPTKIRNEVKSRLSLLWKKIVKCDRHYEEEGKRVSVHWHANFRYEMDEDYYEMEKLQPLENSTAAFV